MPVVPHDKCASVVRGTQNFHMDGRKWSDIAYNFLVCRHGYIFEGRGLNTWNGANGTNYANQTSHAVMVLVGTGNTLTVEAKRAVKQAIAHIANRTNAPGSPVKGHRDHKATECPGDELYKWVHAGLPVSTQPSAPKPQPPEEPYMFKPGQNLEKIVRESYQNIVGREPESQAIVDQWHWGLATQQGGAYASLVNGLHHEARIRSQNRLRELEAKVSNITPSAAGVLTEEQILTTVYRDLTKKIS